MIEQNKINFYNDIIFLLDSSKSMADCSKLKFALREILRVIIKNIHFYTKFI